MAVSKPERGDRRRRWDEQSPFGRCHRRGRSPVISADLQRFTARRWKGTLGQPVKGQAALLEAPRSIPAFPTVFRERPLYHCRMRAAHAAIGSTSEDRFDNPLIRPMLKLEKLL
ncbi:hypothetical protein [Rhizobium yanglingense]